MDAAALLAAGPGPQGRSAFSAERHATDIDNLGSLAAVQMLELCPVLVVALARVEAKKQTFSSFDELLEKSEKPLLVDFYATWCGPCQYMVPILQEVSEKLGDKIQVVKIDTEKYTSIASRYRIEALPTFIIFKDGKPCYRFEGALPVDQMIEQIENALAVTK
ncbi:Thioredoxin Y, chloroplastic [Zea mays]|uniref:Thioredoxin Y, chloroplastic n=1 Tax=Zea mays TaxID=4577 RepID=A0A3L6FBF4_MAIZE|nr:Thioredoxin Y, chloroplastic [Zea mays]